MIIIIMIALYIVIHYTYKPTVIVFILFKILYRKLRIESKFLYKDTIIIVYKYFHFVSVSISNSSFSQESEHFFLLPLP